jgi:hypothetical protein
MIHFREIDVDLVANVRSEVPGMSMTTTTISVTIEGNPYSLEDRDYRGSELRSIAGLSPKDKLVREETDGTETPTPPGKKIRPREGDNLFVSVRFRRG